MTEKTNKELLDSLLIPLIGGANANQPALLAIRAAVVARMSPGWQPIETAPRDGMTILVWRPHAPATVSIVFAAWERGYSTQLGSVASGWVHKSGGSKKLSHQPTHWMPLPEAPR